MRVIGLGKFEYTNFVCSLAASTEANLEIVITVMAQYLKVCLVQGPCSLLCVIEP